MKKNLILLCSLFMATALISSCAQDGPGTGQPDRHGSFEQGFRLPGHSGFFAAGARLRGEGGEGHHQHCGQHLLRTSRGRYGPHLVGALRQDRPAARVALGL